MAPEAPGTLSDSSHVAGVAAALQLAARAPAAVAAGRDAHAWSAASEEVAGVATGGDAHAGAVPSLASLVTVSAGQEGDGV